jgi:Domain of unknown function (DUF4260)
MDLSVARLPNLRRPLYGVAATALLAASIVTFTHVDAGWWVFPVFAVGPDLAFLAGIGHKGSLERGQMPPRAVPLYNAVHRLWGPLALGLVSGVGLLPPVLLVGALVWACHVCVDRAVGYGLRTPDGFQRSR